MNMNWSPRFALIHIHINVISIFCSIQMNWNGHFLLCSAFHSPISIQHFHNSNIRISRNKKEYLHFSLCIPITAFCLAVILWLSVTQMPKKLIENEFNLSNSLHFRTMQTTRHLLSAFLIYSMAELSVAC